MVAGRNFFSLELDASREGACYNKYDVYLRWYFTHGVHNITILYSSQAPNDRKLTLFSSQWSCTTQIFFSIFSKYHTALLSPPPSSYLPSSEILRKFGILHDFYYFLWFETATNALNILFPFYPLPKKQALVPTYYTPVLQYAAHDSNFFGPLMK